MNHFYVNRFTYLHSKEAYFTTLLLLTKGKLKQLIFAKVLIPDRTSNLQPFLTDTPYCSTETTRSHPQCSVVGTLLPGEGSCYKLKTKETSRAMGL